MSHLYIICISHVSSSFGIDDGAFYVEESVKQVIKLCAPCSQHSSSRFSGLQNSIVRLNHCSKIRKRENVNRFKMTDNIPKLREISIATAFPYQSCADLH